MSKTSGTSVVSVPESRTVYNTKGMTALEPDNY